MSRNVASRLRQFGTHVVHSPVILPSRRCHATHATCESHVVDDAGHPGFYAPRFPPPTMSRMARGALSYYDTSRSRPLEETGRLRLINRNGCACRWARSTWHRNSVYFDNTKIKIRAEHVMASERCRPAFHLSKSMATVLDGESSPTRRSGRARRSAGMNALNSRSIFSAPRRKRPSTSRRCRNARRTSSTRARRDSTSTGPGNRSAARIAAAPARQVAESPSDPDVNS